MKKSYLIIAAAATLFAACSDLDTFKEVNNQEGANDGAITFATGSEKVTRAENSNALYTWTFFEHQSNFEVFGFKIIDPTNPVFGKLATENTDAVGTVVNVTSKNSSYEYKYDSDTEPLRFWDKTSPDYQFFAAAPANADWVFTYTGAVAPTENVDAVYGEGTFATTSALNGVNLQSVSNGGATNKLKNTFKTAKVEGGTATDIDKMIAAPCEVKQASYNKPTPDAVHLNFIHILSKLNISISTDLSSIYTVKLLDFKVMNMPGKGNFNEATAAASQTHQYTTTRWNQTGYTYADKINYLTGLDGTEGLAVSSTKQYIVESLVIPQDIKYERVALDGKEHALVHKDAEYFTSYEEYATATPIEDVTVTEADFEDLYKEGENNTKVLRTLAEYQALPGKGETTEAQYKALLEKIIKTKAVDVAKYEKVQNTDADHSSEPYFMIKYSINNDVFTAYYNLTAAFNGLTNNETSFTGEKEGKDVLGFYEGWQNTLNINIHPTEITFTADIADWSTIESDSDADTDGNQPYDIEQGNY